MEQNKSLLEAVRNYVAGFQGLDALSLHYDQTDEEPQSYAVTSAGLVKLSQSVTGKQTWQYNALLTSREYTADDMSRLCASEFTEGFTFWIDDNNKTGQLPALPTGMTPVSVSADNGMLLFLDDDGDRGVYQIQIHLTFTRR